MKIILRIIFFVLPAIQAAYAKDHQLPALTLDCYQSYAVGFHSPGSENEKFSGPVISLDGDNLNIPRFRILTIDGQTLKVIKDPSRPQFRTEFGKSVYELTFDFMHKNNIFGWKEDSVTGTKIYNIDSEAKILSVLSINKPEVRSLSILEVLNCRSSAQ